MKGGEVALPREDLFSKEACGIAGRGAMLWTYTGSETWQSAMLPAVTEGELLDALSQLSRNTPHYFAAANAHHPAIAPLSFGALCTARIVTCRGFDTTPESFAQYFECRSRVGLSMLLTGWLGQRGRQRWHWAGRLEEPSRRYAPSRVSSRHWSSHYRNATALLERSQTKWWWLSMRCIRQFPSIRWDVAITPERPVMIEANAGRASGWSNTRRPAVRTHSLDRELPRLGPSRRAPRQQSRLAHSTRETDADCPIEWSTVLLAAPFTKAR